MKSALTATLVAAAFLAWSLAAHGQTIEGPAQARSGNTIDLTGTVIRLRGVDAPAVAQSCLRDRQSWPCGSEAKALLAKLIGAKNVHCDALTRGQDDMLAGACSADGLDLGEAMVASGLALAANDGGPNYSAEEARAKSLKLGMWGADFELPSAWRAAHPEPALAARVKARGAEKAPAPRVYRNAFGCAIKGNHSRRGDWIYYLPGMRYYEETRPEDLFCTEEEAVAAGYRRSRAG